MFADLPIVMGPSLYAQCSGGSPPAGGGGGALSEDALCMADSCPAQCMQRGLSHAGGGVRTEERAWDMGVECYRRRHLEGIWKRGSVLECC